MFGIWEEEWEQNEVEKEIRRISNAKNQIPNSKKKDLIEDGERLELKELTKEKKQDWGERDFV